MTVEYGSSGAAVGDTRRFAFTGGPLAGTVVVEKMVGQSANGGYSYAFVPDEMTYPCPVLPCKVDMYIATLNLIEMGDQTMISCGLLLFCLLLLFLFLLLLLLLLSCLLHLVYQI